MKLNYIVGLVLTILAIIVAFQNGGAMIGVKLLFWGVRTSLGLIIIGSIISGVLFGSLIQLRGK